VEKLSLPKGETVTLATAHPAKFPGVTEAATGAKIHLPKKLAELLTGEIKREIVKNDVDYIKHALEERFSHKEKL
jgi:threonine synthase